MYRILGNFRVVNFLCDNISCCKILWSGVIHENILTAMSKKHGASTRALVRFRRGYEREVGPVESQASY